MEQELSFLRRKVTRLENMIHNINDKIGLVLEKFFNHRASQAKNEEDLCISLAVQLKTCLISSEKSDGGGGGGGVDKGNKGNGNESRIQTLTSSNNNSKRPQVQSTFKPSQPNRFRQIQTCRKSTGHPPTRFRISSSPRSILPRPSLPSQSTSFSNWSQSQPPPQPQVQRRQPDASNAGSHEKAQNQHLRRQQVEDPLGFGSFGPGDLAQATLDRSLPTQAQDADNNIIILKAESLSGGFHSEMDDADTEMDVYLETSNDSVTEIDPDPDYNPSAKKPRTKQPRSLVPGGGAAGTSQAARPRDPSFWRRRFARKEYTITRTFPNEQAARDQIRSERFWRVNSAQFTKTAKKIYYQCSHAQCPVTMYLLVPKGSETTEERVSVGQHMHD